METTNYVEFKKTRDLGSIITDTFKFIRENWKSYFGVLLRLVGPILAITVVLLGFYMYLFSGVFSNSVGTTDPFSSASSGTLILTVLLMMIAFLVLYVLLQSTSLYYLKLYITKEEITQNRIWRMTKKTFWNFFGLFFMMIIIGLVVYIIGGLLLVGFIFVVGQILGAILGMLTIFFLLLSLLTPFALAFPIMAFENKGIFETLFKSIRILKNNFWVTFGCILTVTLLVGILGLVFSVPAIIYQMVGMMTSIGREDPTAILGFLSDPIYILLNLISYIGKFALSAITLIATVFIYFDLNEQKNLTGTIETIERLGSN